MKDGVGPRSLLDRIWDAHCVAALPGGYDLLFVDRHLIHDLGAPGAFDQLRRRELGVRSPALTIAGDPVRGRLNLSRRPAPAARATQPRWSTRAQLSSAIFEWIECFYNPILRHSSVGMLSPINYETTTAA